MNPISPSVIPAPRGLEKEEPEFAEEDDIPSDDRGSVDSIDSHREGWDVERE